MRKFIERMQEKPEHERKRFAFATSLVVTLLIAGVWTSTFFNQSSEVVVVREETPGPFEALSRQVAGAYAALKAEVSDWGEDGDLEDGVVFDDELDSENISPQERGDGVAPRVTNVKIE